jgi:hypothetical protein
MGVMTFPKEDDAETIAGYIVIRDFDGTEQTLPVKTTRRPEPPQPEET